jgi:hypothetical protein
MAVDRPSNSARAARAAEFVLDAPQERPAGEREIEVEAGDQLGRQVSQRSAASAARVTGVSMS